MPGLETLVLTTSLYGIAPADLDQDGWVDLVGYSHLHAGLVVYHNQAGVLGPREVLSHESITRLTPIDLDGDGFPEICHDKEDAVYCRDNLGGTLGEPLWVFAPSSNVHDLVPVDFEGDGDQDLLLPSSDLFLLENDGTGALTARVLLDDYLDEIAAGDMDGDGDTDLVMSDGWGLLRAENLGDTFAVYTLVEHADYPRALRMADVDDDGDLDPLALGGGPFGEPGVVWFANEGDSFGPPEHISHGDGLAIELIDLDADGKPELVAPDGVGGVGWYALDGSASGTLAPAVDGGYALLGLGGADLDLDGDIEIVSLTQDLIQWEGTSGQSTLLEQGGATIRSVEVGDVDLDGRLDLVYGSGFDHRVLLNRGTEDGWAPTERILSPTHQFGPVHLLDLDGDGDEDLLTSTDFGIVSFDNLAGTFGPERMHTQDEGVVVLTPDLDSDGDADLLVETVTGVEWLANDGTGSFLAPVVLHEGRVTASDVGDLDGDGDLDLVVTVYYPSEVVQVLASAPGLFETPVSIGPTGDNPNGIRAADMDGDGDLDLVYEETVACPQICNKVLRQRTNLGAGQFFEGPKLDQTGAPFTLIDHDADGLLDIVSSNGSHLVLFLSSLDFGGLALTEVGSFSEALVQDLEGDDDVEIAVVQYGEMFVLRETEEVPEEEPEPTGDTAEPPPPEPDTGSPTAAPEGEDKPEERGCGCDTSASPGWALLLAIAASARGLRRAPPSPTAGPRAARPDRGLSR